MTNTKVKPSSKSVVKKQEVNKENKSNRGLTKVSTPIDESGYINKDTKPKIIKPVKQTTAKKEVKKPIEEKTKTELPKKKVIVQKTIKPKVKPKLSVTAVIGKAFDNSLGNMNINESTSQPKEEVKIISSVKPSVTSNEGISVGELFNKMNKSSQLNTSIIPGLNIKR